VAFEERAVRVFGRAHTPLAEPAAKSSNVSFDLGNDFFSTAGHGCNPPPKISPGTLFPRKACPELAEGRESTSSWTGVDPRFCVGDDAVFHFVFAATNIAGGAL
jgi:hypothetical protein